MSQSQAAILPDLPQGTWREVPGPSPTGALYLGVGSSGAVWCLAGNPVDGIRGGSVQPFLLEGESWVGIDGGLSQLAVDSNGNPWGFNVKSQIFHRQNNQWQLLPGLATGIAIGANNAVWVLGTDPVGEGFQPFAWNGSNWQGIDGGLISIAVGPDGEPWGTNKKGQIFHRQNNQWHLLPGRAGAASIAVGPNGTAWVLGTDVVSKTGYDFQPFYWNGSSWAGIDGGLNRSLAVGPDNSLWGINYHGQIWHRS